MLRIVTPAELKRLNGSRPKMGGGAGSGDVNGRLTHVASPPVYRGTLTPFRRTPCETWEARCTLGQGSPDRVAQAQVRGMVQRGKDREEAKAVR